jgi:hypothetical protein
MKSLKTLWNALAVIIFVCVLSIRAFGGQWLAGDLHAHSLHSDGDSSVADIIKEVREKGLDFFALTDHDTSMKGSPTHWYDADYQGDNDLTLLYGIEWTSKMGHANVFAAQPFDYSELWEANQQQDVPKAIDSAHKQNALFSINHPKAFRSLWWQYPVYEGVDSVEVWNAGYRMPNRNYKSVQEFWDTILKNGRIMPALGGSDTHNLDGLISHLMGIGYPTTWVYAAENTPQGILDAMKSGNTSIGYGPDAERLVLWVDTDGDKEPDMMAGDNAETFSGKVEIGIDIQRPNQKSSAIHFGEVEEVDRETLRALREGRVHIQDILATSDKLAKKLKAVRLYKDGELYKVWKITEGVRTFSFSQVIVGERKTYYRAELIGKPSANWLKRMLLFGKIISMSNPVYFNF